eukprot:GHVQ01033818.1.p1 GENE.GHVQ01033818.1~~GHVQ01033818.1.p1  ORF type:complete len:243 (-),score=37.57 GHVQ01033818.1:214-942(-)
MMSVRKLYFVICCVVVSLHSIHSAQADLLHEREASFAEPRAVPRQLQPSSDDDEPWTDEGFSSVDEEGEEQRTEAGFASVDEEGEERQRESVAEPHAAPRHLQPSSDRSFGPSWLWGVLVDIINAVTATTRTSTPAPSYSWRTTTSTAPPSNRPWRTTTSTPSPSKRVCYSCGQTINGKSYVPYTVAPVGVADAIPNCYHGLCGRCRDRKYDAHASTLGCSKPGCHQEGVPSTGFMLNPIDD